MNCSGTYPRPCLIMFSSFRLLPAHTRVTGMVTSLKLALMYSTDITMGLSTAPPKRTCAHHTVVVVLIVTIPAYSAVYEPMIMIYDININRSPPSYRNIETDVHPTVPYDSATCMIAVTGPASVRYRHDIHAGQRIVVCSLSRQSQVDPGHGFGTSRAVREASNGHANTRQTDCTSSGERHAVPAHAQQGTTNDVQPTI